MPTCPLQKNKSSNVALRPLNNERGMALIIAITLLAVMSLLGAMLMTASTSEIKLSGNYRSSKEAFYAAERGLDYAMQELTDNALTVGESIDLVHDEISLGVTHSSLITVGNSGLETTPVSGALDKTDANTVTYVNTGPPPAIFASDASSFEARNFAVTVVGVAPAGSPNPSRTVIRSQVARLVPKAN